MSGSLSVNGDVPGLPTRPPGSSNIEMQAVLSHRKDMVSEEVKDSCISSLILRADFRAEASA